MNNSRVVQSLDRGLRILEMVCASDTGLSLSDLARDLGVKPPTAFALANTLVSRGYLEKTSRPVRYRLGPGVLELMAARVRRDLLLRGAGVIRDLFDKLATATVVLAEPLGGEIIASLRMDPARPAMLERAPNWSFPPYSTALGLCFQAFWPTPERVAYRQRHPFREYGRMHWASESALDAFLETARRKGAIIVTDGRPMRVAAPVYGPGGQFVAGIGASLAHDSDPGPETARRVTDAVMRAARTLSAGSNTEPHQGGR